MKSRRVFALALGRARAGAIAQTRAPSDAELSIIARLDPNDVRAGVIKDDPKVRDAS